MATPTLEDIATWPTPDYDNPRDTLNAAVYAVEIPMIILMAFFVGGRFISRTVIVKGALGSDDWTMLAACVLAIAQAAVHIYEVNVGIGRHLYDVPFEWYSPAGKFTLVTMTMFGPTTALTKISICLTYLRIFQSKTNRWFNYVTMALLTTWGISTTAGMLLQCTPISDVWNFLKPQDKKDCINMEAFYLTTAAINAFLDCLVYLWPIHYLIRVNIPLRLRIELVVCFSVGVLICAVGFLRLGWMVKFFDSWDMTYQGAIVYIIVAFETDLGIICGCLPGIRPLITKAFPNMFGPGTKHSKTGFSKKFGSHTWEPRNVSPTAPPKAYWGQNTQGINKEIQLTVSSKDFEPGVQDADSSTSLAQPWDEPQQSYRKEWV